MDKELVIRLNEAQTRILVEWYQEVLWNEYENCWLYGAVPRRMSEEVFNRRRTLDTYNCLRYE